jgi:polar amino acid transport system substrate-binding protein
MVKRIFASGILVLCFVSGSVMTAWGGSGKTVVALDQNYPPYSSGTAQQATGLYVDLIRAVFTRMGMEVDFQPLPWKKALKESAEGRMAVGGIYKNKTRLKIYDYSEPLFEERLNVYVEKGKAFPFHRLSDLQGKTIGLNRGWSYGDAFDAARKKYHFTADEVDSNLQNFRKLLSGKIDCLVADQVAASRILHRENWSDRVESLSRPAAVNYAYLAFAKRLKKRDLLERFNKALAEMKKDGSYEKLIGNFMAAPSE